MSFDRADRAIISALQDNARLTNVELADRVGLSPSACLRRVNLLEKKGSFQVTMLRLMPQKSAMMWWFWFRLP